jgi:thioesterase domain-containing protein
MFMPKTERQPSMSALPDPAAAIRLVQAEWLTMPPVVAMDPSIVDASAERLRLHAPLAANVNDKGCAFGGSLSSLMTLAGWGLIMLRLAEAGLQAEVYVADSSTRYRAPLYDDLEACAELAEGESWDSFFDTLCNRGRARLAVRATVTLPEGGLATEMHARYAAKLKR